MTLKPCDSKSKIFTRYRVFKQFSRVRFSSGALSMLGLSILSFGPTIRFSAWKNSAPAVRYFREGPYVEFNNICVGNSDLFKNRTKTIPNLPEELHILYFTSQNYYGYQWRQFIKIVTESNRRSFIITRLIESCKSHVRFKSDLPDKHI